MRYTPDYRLAYGLVCVFLASACSTGSLDIPVKETDQGAVYVERSDDRSLQAAHPITISQKTMVRVLRGIAYLEDPGILKKLAGGENEPVSVFKEEEVLFLAPLLVEGLATAAPDQQVGFRLGAARASSDARKGSLYAYGRSLYVVLPWLQLESRYGAGGNAPSKTMVFIPESAKRPDSYRRGSSPDTTVIVDYEMVAALPDNFYPTVPAALPPAAASAPTVEPAQVEAGTDAQLKTLQEQMKEKTTEVEELKKELQEIREQMLESREGSGKGKKTPPAATKAP